LATPAFVWLASAVVLVLDGCGAAVVLAQGYDG
jgi:hypothetical protein